MSPRRNFFKFKVRPNARRLASCPTANGCRFIHEIPPNEKGRLNEETPPFVDVEVCEICPLITQRRIGVELNANLLQRHRLTRGQCNTLRLYPGAPAFDVPQVNAESLPGQNFT
jgi:hypothetical protein